MTITIQISRIEEMRSPAQYFLVIISTFLFVITLLFTKFQTQKVFSVSPNIVISEIQVRSVIDADDEFVELYNPSGESINISGWKLTKRTQSGTQTNLVASLSGYISPKGFFLITSQASLSSPSADQLYSTTQRIAADNTVTLIAEDGISVVDSVGLGAASASETATVANPVNSGSIERKAQSSSTSISMAVGGIDSLLGNGWDSDNNSLDFVQRTVSQPQNSYSLIEPAVIPTPTETNTPTPTSTPSDTPTPSMTPLPTATLTSTPSSTPTPSMTPLPTATPTSTPSNTPTPSMTPSPTTAPSPYPFPMFKLVCTVTEKNIYLPLGILHLRIPMCRLMSL